MTGFADSIARYSEKAQVKVDTVVTRTVQELGKTLISFTHIDTGKLVSNYNYSAEAPNPRVTEATKIRTVNDIEDIPKKAAGHKHYIASGVAYAGHAEFGTSRMAPHMMFGLTIQGFQATVDRAANEVAR